jgi:hypothetical protein
VDINHSIAEKGWRLISTLLAIFHCAMHCLILFMPGVHQNCKSLTTTSCRRVPKLLIGASFLFQQVMDLEARVEQLTEELKSAASGKGARSKADGAAAELLPRAGAAAKHVLQGHRGTQKCTHPPVGNGPQAWHLVMIGNCFCASIMHSWHIASMFPYSC